MRFTQFETYFTVEQHLFCHIYNFLNFQKNAYDYEHSELLLYQNMVMQESGDYAGALAHLDKYEVKF